MAVYLPVVGALLVGEGDVASLAPAAIGVAVVGILRPPPRGSRKASAGSFSAALRLSQK